MNIAILENQTQDYIHLHNILSNSAFYSSMELSVCHFQSAEAFLDTFHPDKYQLLLTDIALGGEMNGIALARKLRTMTKTLPIVYITRERQYALEAFQVQAMDYLLKPCRPEQVDGVLQRILEAGAVKAHICVQVGRKTVRFPLDSFMWAAADNHVTRIHLSDHRILRSYIRFKAFSDLLPDSEDFSCCSRGILVSMKYVDSIENQDFLLTDGTHLPINRSKKTDMARAFSSYQTRCARGGLL